MLSSITLLLKGGGETERGGRDGRGGETERGGETKEGERQKEGRDERGGGMRICHLSSCYVFPLRFDVSILCSPNTSFIAFIDHVISKCMREKQNV